MTTSKLTSASLFVSIGLCLLGLVSCSGDQVDVNSGGAEDVTTRTASPEPRFFIDLPLGEIQTREALAALRGTAWIAYPYSDPPSHGAVSFAWDTDFGLIGSFSDDCGGGGFSLSGPTPTGWEVQQTSLASEVGCVSALASIFTTGVEVRLSRTESGISVEAPNIGFFDAVHWQSTSIHNDPLGLDVPAEAIDGARLEDRPVESTTIDPNGPNN